METYDLSIRIGKRERLRLPVSGRDLNYVGNVLLEYRDSLCQSGPVAVIVRDPAGIDHILARWSAAS